MVRLIKRYGNRKLYDVRRSRYITLDGIRALVQESEDVRVIDNDTGEDLTGITFAQIIYEAAKRTNGEDSLPLLRWVIQRGDEAVKDIRQSVEKGRDAIDSVREAAERKVQKLVGTAAKRPRGLLEDLLDAPQKRLDDLQHRIDAQIRQSLEKVTSHPEIQRVERSIHELEKRLGKLGGASQPTRAGRGAKRPRAAKKAQPKRQRKRPS